MTEKVRFAFTELDRAMGELSTFPYLPVTLARQNQAYECAALLDTGASVNVLPYDLGLRLGVVWEQQRFVIPLGGNLANSEARAIVLTAKIAEFEAVDLAFAWTSDRTAPLILGQVNFFQAFDVCFYRSELAFEVCPRRSLDSQ